MIIAIDGPAGAGKSTVAKLLAKKLGFLYIDTGAMYRALTVKAIRDGIDIRNASRVVKMAKASRIDLIGKKDGSLEVLLDGKDVSKAIREPAVTSRVSDVAKIKGVRQVMACLQRKLGKKKDSVLEGRDIGTVVFPGAEKKFFIDADFTERVKRRYKDLKDLKIHKVSSAQVACDLSNRDTIDSTRKCAPLKKAIDAIYIDTTDLTIKQVVAAMAGHIGPREKSK